MWDFRNLFAENILPIKVRAHICHCPLAVRISKKIWNQTYFEPMTVDSVEIFHHFAFWRIQNCQLFLLYLRTKGYRYFFPLTYMWGWLVGCQLKNQVVPLGKVFLPHTVVWYKFLVKFFGGKKEKQGLCLALISSQGGRRSMDFRVS